MHFYPKVYNHRFENLNFTQKTPQATNVKHIFFILRLISYYTVLYEKKYFQYFHASVTENYIRHKTPNFGIFSSDFCQ